MSLPTRLRLWTIVIIAGVLYLLAQFGVGLYTDFLWFQHLNLDSVFLTGLWARVGVGLAVAGPVVVLFWLNVFIARWQSVQNVLFFSDETLVAQRFIVWLTWAAGLVLGWLVAVAASNDWLLFLRFLNRQSFNLADPIFNMDVGFYIFSLPVYHFVQRWLVIALFLSLIGAAAIYALAQQNNLTEGRLVILPHVQLHLAVLGIFIFLAFAVGHWLDRFDLMYSTRGVAFGASYTDINVALPALWVMIAIAVIAAGILLVNIFLRRAALSLLAVFIWIVTGIVGAGFIPGLVQRYMVEPNELASEAPYIENNIRFTNLAYGLDRVQERDFSEVAPLSSEMLTDNEATLKNIRLWDYRPLQQTYQQIQAIRLYYRFFDIDLDRYTINDEIRQVALAARELDVSRLQDPTWVTQRLQFTHGYGAVVNPVNEVTGDGLPLLWVKDLPPESSVGLDITRPEIYHGEGTADYVFVQTQEREFSYPSGDQNVYTNYEGSGGVVLDSYLKRLAFALRLADVNMLLSQDFTPTSRVMLFRNITDRARHIAPFLRYDSDPYLIINPDGQLYWLLDAYTTSNLFPYSEPIGDLNYIRNSVKVVIDAYNGTPTFYVIDPTDPLIQSYLAIFPGLFTPLADMPDWLRAHLRYPEDLFTIQARLFQTYHMRDVNVFYNKEDLWQTPKETFAGNTQDVEPYYVVLRLPGETQNEYVLTQPFTPNTKDNLIAWLAARSDGENYGQLIVYRFPKQELVFGPLQIEGRIDQDPEISAQITLWSQSGSQVIRGNLLVLPIDNSLLYVEPLYLQAVNGQIPELKRVIVVSGDRVVMRETLAAGLQALFGEAGPPLTSTQSPTPPAVPTEPLSDDLNQLAITASNHYEAAQKALQNGDWATYGEELEKMKAALDALVRLTSEQ
ncbi:MAG: UPF0182 family protein [Anaerolineae bacterium]|nr:UPF0182 family protein [Anaerolineales bacterium]MCQ3977298.1 UPF0182 family protein [Anaerolineae bacterium]